MQLRQIARLDGWYRFDETGPQFLTGLQALVRLLLAQSYRDRLAGRNTAGFVSGYRGSPGSTASSGERLRSSTPPASVFNPA